jgi:hypothetical protein
MIFLNLVFSLVCFFFSFLVWGETTSATNWPIVPASDDDDDERGAVGGMRIGRGNRGIRRKPAPVPLCPQQFPHKMTCARTRATALGSGRLIA